MSSVKKKEKKRQFYTFLSNLHNFISYSCLTALARISGTTLKWSSQMETSLPCLVPNLKGKSLCFLTLNIMLTIGFCRYSHSSWRGYLLMNTSISSSVHLKEFVFRKHFFNIKCWSSTLFFMLCVRTLRSWISETCPRPKRETKTKTQNIPLSFFLFYHVATVHDISFHDMVINQHVYSWYLQCIPKCPLYSSEN